MLLAFLLFYFPSVLTLLSDERAPLSWTVTAIVMATFYTIVFCLNYFKLVPWLIIRTDRKSLYFLINLCLILAICCLIPLWFEATGGLPRPKVQPQEALSTTQYLLGYLRFVIRDGIMMVLSAAMAYALRLSEERERLKRRDLELNAEKRQIELMSLKAQLNPHFLFNSLNNIYALIGFDPERAQTALHDLSNMLRFMIYDSGSATVPLSKEMKFINEYVALMKLRLNSNIKVETNIKVSENEDFPVTPLLFLTLVENAFKHVAPASDGKGFIKIEVKIKGGTLIGSISNTFNESKSGTGVGLENVRRQLRLLYPDNHSLLIKDSDGIFFATITINLSALKSV